jgi:uncharacterized delta-60 repeat protein
MKRLLTAIAATGVAAMFALAPGTSQAGFAANVRQQGATRLLSVASAKALAVQPDGKIVAGGRRAGLGYTGDPAEAPDFALARYQPNGRLDPSFGKGGRVLTDFGLSSDVLWAIVLQPNGKIVAAGSSTPRTRGVSAFALARYDSRGRLDPGFGKHGKVRVHFGPSGSGAFALALQPDGKIVAAGANYGNGDSHASWVVARFNSDGTLDRSFGDSGAVTTVFGPVTEADAVTLDGNGKIVVLGDSCQTEDPWTGCELALARYEADGSLDPSFGSGGKATTQYSGYDDFVGEGVAVQPDGKIVAAGSAGRIADDNYNFVLARYDADGSLDTEFGTGGTVITDFEPGSDGSEDYAWSLALGTDGAIAVSGVSAGGFTVALFEPNGNLDPSFGGTGFVHTDLSGGDDDEARAVAIAADGKIVAAGVAGETRFALVRYSRDGALDAGFGKDGKVFTDFGSPVTILASFSAADTDHGVLVRWRTSVEVNARGFNVYREVKGRRVRANQKLLTSRGSSARGASYSFLDKAAPRHGALLCWLQVVKKDGTRVWYGPVVPQR